MFGKPDKQDDIGTEPVNGDHEPITWEGDDVVDESEPVVLDIELGEYDDEDEVEPVEVEPDPVESETVDAAPAPRPGPRLIPPKNPPVSG